MKLYRDPQTLNDPVGVILSRDELAQVMQALNDRRQDLALTLQLVQDHAASVRLQEKHATVQGLTDRLVRLSAMQLRVVRKG